MATPTEVSARTSVPAPRAITFLASIVLAPPLVACTRKPSAEAEGDRRHIPQPRGTSACLAPRESHCNAAASAASVQQTLSRISEAPRTEHANARGAGGPSPARLCRRRREPR